MPEPNQNPEQKARKIDVSLQRTEALPQSILKRAFSGQLVPQVPTDEPATRVQAKREALTLKNPKKKATKKKTAPTKTN